MIGWFGFNPGSELAADAFVPADRRHDPARRRAGALVAMVVTWFKDGKPDVAMAGNGLLAGLVGDHRPRGRSQHLESILIGAIGGAIVVFAVYFFDRIRIDDPVGAISVHGVCGAWGTLSVGLFAHTTTPSWVARTPACSTAAAPTSWSPRSSRRGHRRLRGCCMASLFLAIKSRSASG